VMALAFLGLRFQRSGGWESPTAFEVLEGVCSILAGLYYAWHFARIQYRWPMIDPLTSGDLLFGLVILLLVLDMTRRVVGWPIVVIAALFILYALAGQFVAGSFSHRPFSLAEFLDQRFAERPDVHLSGKFLQASIVVSGVLRVHSLESRRDVGRQERAVQWTQPAQRRPSCGGFLPQ